MKRWYIIDGQQRLTTLLLAFNNWKLSRGGKIIPGVQPISYVLAKKAFERDSRGTRGINLAKILDAAARQEYDELLRGIEREDFRETLKNIGKHIMEYQLPVYIIQTQNETPETFNEMAHAFTRVNTAGMRISSAELLLSLMAGSIPGGEKTRISEYANNLESSIDLPPSVFIRSVFSELNLTQRQIGNIRQFESNIKRIQDVSPETRMDTIERCYRAYQQAAEIFNGEFGIRTVNQFPTTYSLLPIVAHLIARSRSNKVTDAIARKDIAEWFLLVNFTGYYSSRRDIKLQEDIETTRENIFPFGKLIANIGRNRGITKIDYQHVREDFAKYHVLKDEGLGNLMLVYVTEHNNNADDWNGHVLSERNYTELERHHIFPKNYIIKMVNNGVVASSDSDEEGEELFINTAANITFIDQYINESISDDSPEEYIPRYHDSAMRHFIPDNPELWKFERYDDFLAERTKLIYENVRSRYQRIFTELEGAEKHLSAIHISRRRSRRTPKAQEEISVGNTEHEKALFKRLEADIKKFGYDVIIKLRKRGYVKFRREGHKSGFVWVIPDDAGLKIELNPNDVPAPTGINVKYRRNEPWSWWFYLDEANYDKTLELIRADYNRID